MWCVHTDAGDGSEPSGANWPGSPQESFPAALLGLLTPALLMTLQEEVILHQ